MARPRSFDDTAALDAALGCFWGRGYEATSIRDLTAAMGIGGPSLYNAFGDKRSLYAGALEHYCRTRTYPMLERLERDYAGAAAISAFFAEIIARSLADRECRGCFLINSAIDVAPHDRELAVAVTRHLAVIRAFLARSLRVAGESGSAKCVPDARSAADHLLAVLLGIRVLARTRPERKVLERTVYAALRAVGLDNEQLHSPSPARRGARSVRVRRDRGRQQAL